MPRDVNTPLVLWLVAAVCAHTVLGKGTKEFADQTQDRESIAGLMANVRDFVKKDECRRDPFAVGCETPPETELSIAQEDTPKVEEREEAKAPDDPTKDDPEEKKDKKDETKPIAAVVPPTPVTPPKVEPPKVVPPTPEKKVEPPKVEEKKVAVIPPPPAPKKEEEAKPLPPPPARAPARVAVRQQVDPNQQDNPNARFIGDEANKVKEETVATQTNLEKDDKNPTPGGNHSGPDQRPGDSDRHRIAQDEDRKGERNVAPGDRGKETDIHKESPAAAARVASNAPPVPAPHPGNNGDNRPRAPQPAPVQVNQPPPSPALPNAGGASRPASPEVITSVGGTDSVPAPRPANSGTGGTNRIGPGSVVRPPPVPAPVSGGMLPFGRGQAGFNLNQQQIAQNVVGAAAITQQRVADGERRKSEHRGSWHASNFERWRSAIENYVSSVKPGNQTALNTARVPFASYLNGMHNRIHPIFADSFLGSLDSLPRDNPLNDPKISTHLEIVLTKTGELHRMGVVKTSGITAFDVAALDSVFRAKPFGPAPAAIVSPDGNVYLHWEFHRDEVFACSTMNARPFLLNVQPPPAPTDPVAPPPAGTVPTRERGAPPAVNTRETQQGALPPVRDPSHT